MVDAAGPLLGRLDPRIRVVGLNASRGLKAILPLCRHLQRAPEVPILVFGFNLGVGLLLARRIGLHRSPVIYREGSAPKWNIKSSQQWGYPWAISKADQVISQSKATRQELVELGVPGEIIHVIPNPQWRPGPPDNNSQRESKEAPLLLAVGRLAPEKGLRRLIRGFKRLHERIPAAQLTILGEGTERHRLEALVTELGLTGHVSLPGFVSDLVPWYRRASVFVLPSHYEGQSNALIEAMLNECPILCAAHRGGTVELMQAAGLEDCLLPDDQFEERFGEATQYVLAQGGSRWRTARERLAKLTDFETVVRDYLCVCGVQTERRSPTLC